MEINSEAIEAALNVCCRRQQTSHDGHVTGSTQPLPDTAISQTLSHFWQ